MAAPVTVSDCPPAETDLQADINNAGPGGTVSFHCATDTMISFASPITIIRDVTLDASHSIGKVTLDGGGDTHLFRVNYPATFSLNSLTLRHGADVSVGVLINFGGTVNVSGGTVFDNSSAGDAGAIYDDHGTLNVTGSTFSSNSLTRNGYGGAIFNYAGTADIIASTFYGNSAAGGGGAVDNFLGGTLNIGGDIFADGPSGGNCANTSGTINDQGYNLDTDDSCTSGKTGDITGTDPLLGPLQDNGGPTETMALASTSSAIDQIPVGVPFRPSPGTDQRGVPRPMGTKCDIGAFEYAGNNNAFYTACPTNESDLGHDIAADTLQYGGAFFFDCPTDETISVTTTMTLSGISPTMPVDLAIVGDGGPGRVTLDGGGDTQLFSDASNMNFGVSSLTFADCSAVDGGAIASDTASSNLTVAASTFSGNSSNYGGGVIYSKGGLAIINSTLFNNPAYGLGAIYSGGSLDIGGTILAANQGANCAFPGGVPTVTDWGDNLADDSFDSCGFSTGDHDIIEDTTAAAGLDLNGLQDNGGPTDTVALLPTSSAIDQIPLGYTDSGTGPDLCLGAWIDQRGYSRPDDSDSVCDMGAYESDYQATTLAVRPASGVYGGTTNLSATLTSNSTDVSGEVIIFYLNGTRVCGGISQATCPTTDSSGVATLSGVSLAGISVGTYPSGGNSCTSTTGVYASFAGDQTNNLSHGSGCNTLTVTQASTTTTLTSSPNPSTTGQSVTFTATIAVTSPGAGTPTGTVTFQDNGSDIQTCSSQMVSPTTETATCQTTSLSQGIHTITALYSGDGNFLGSTGTLQQDVSRTVPNGTTAYDIESSNWSCNEGGITCIPSSDPDASACVTMTPCPSASYGAVDAFGPPTNIATGIPDELILACVHGTRTGYQIGYLDVLSHQGTIDYPGGVYGTADPGIISGKGTVIGGGGEGNPSQPSSVVASAFDARTGIRGNVTGIQNTDNTTDSLNSGELRITISGRLWTVTNGQTPVRNTTNSTISCTVGGSQATELQDAGRDTDALAEGILESSLGDTFFLPTIAPPTPSG